MKKTSQPRSAWAVHSDKQCTNTTDFKSIQVVSSWDWLHVVQGPDYKRDTVKAGLEK